MVECHNNAWQCYSLVSDRFDHFLTVHWFIISSAAQENTYICTVTGYFGAPAPLLPFISFFSTKNSTQKTDAVIMEGDAPLMNRELKGKPLMLVPEGTVVKIEDEQNGWVQVKLPNGREGWLQQNLVSRV